GFQRGDRPGTEYAVDAAGGEAERAQVFLQVADVVASEHRRAQVQEPVAEAVPGFDERTPRLGSTDPVDSQASVLLEPSDGCFGRRAVDRDRVVGQIVTQPRQPALYI